MKKSWVVVSLVAAMMSANYAMAGCGKCGTHKETDKKAKCGDKTDCVAKAKCKDKGTCADATKSVAGKAGDSKEAATAEGSINTAGVAALIKAGTPLTILDARSGKYDDGRRIPGAKSLNSESKSEEVAAVLPDKNGLILTYCAGLKCPASRMLAERLKTLGYGNVVEYPEGIEGWVNDGNKVDGGKE